MRWIDVPRIRATSFSVSTVCFNDKVSHNTASIYVIACSVALNTTLCSQLYALNAASDSAATRVLGASMTRFTVYCEVVRSADDRIGYARHNQPCTLGGIITTFVTSNSRFSCVPLYLKNVVKCHYKQCQIALCITCRIVPRASV